jgi:molybdopterin-guanine dinucleotide biosynthesis protein MobB
MAPSPRHRRPADPPAVPPGPVLAVCGWSGSGKTTVLAAVIPRLVERGLAVAVVKHDAHGIRVDPEGKDSDRLFRAGADVHLHGADQALIRRWRGNGEATSGRSRGAEEAAHDLWATLRRLLESYDVVLVEGHKGTPLPKVWIASADEPEPPAAVTGVRAVLPWDSDRPAALERFVDDWLPRAWREPPVAAGVLVGGASRRMGSPKQLLELGGRTFLERTIDALAPHAERVVLIGEGPVPPAAADLPRIPDPPGLGGPLAGILGAMRWAPDATWLVAGCDQPLITGEAVAWLLDRRRPGIWAVMPRLRESGVEPLLAVYDARVRSLLETIAAAGRLAPGVIASDPRILTPRPDGELARAWRNVNTPEELEALRGEEG